MLAAQLTRCCHHRCRRTAAAAFAAAQGVRRLNLNQRGELLKHLLGGALVAAGGDAAACASVIDTVVGPVAARMNTVVAAAAHTPASQVSRLLRHVYQRIVERMLPEFELAAAAIMHLKLSAKCEQLDADVV
jgi:hypothetical protein